MLHSSLSSQLTKMTENFMISAWHICVLGHDVCQHSVQKGQQMCTSICSAFPMASRNEAHETLSLLFAWDGILLACICENAKEIIQGKFYQKLKDAACNQNCRKRD